MPLVAIPGKIKVIGRQAIIVMDAGNAHKAVHITEDAMDGVDTRSATFPAAQMTVFEKVASLKFERGELAFDGDIWITEEDICNWGHNRPH
ncbi:hypothetical protein ASE04_23690 [Rhizobium sp. Root708]|uniref:hypothetical protein n=1 Tax=Rhizobium sp. Root708 TaxID=1736592 RepID=UPI0006F6DA5C|nr:hypothetical protein [Rhizobium sp. Root708]KRB60619.1 hypothetical protein ASE04_23690 [Rhizobium sp. Root708]